MKAESTLKTKLRKLRKLIEIPEEINDIRAIEKRVRENVVRASLLNNDGAVMIVQEAKARVEAINFSLLHDETLGEQERRDLFTERRVTKFFLSRFNAEQAERELEAINAGLDKKIAYFSE